MSNNDDTDAQAYGRQPEQHGACRLPSDRREGKDHEQHPAASPASH